MRGLLRIVGPLPPVLGLGALRMACPQAGTSLAGPETGAGQMLAFATAPASMAGELFQHSGKYQRAGTTIRLAPAI